MDAHAVGVIASQLSANFSILLDELLLVPAPDREIPVPAPVPEVGVIGVVAPPVVEVPADVIGAFHFVGALPFVGLAGFEPLCGREGGVAPVDFLVHPGLCGFDAARKYDEGLFLRPSLFACVMTAITDTLQFWSAHWNDSFAFACALDV
ncbi:hypothetical protein PQR66_35045 [Paraburkholderia agricolaris]|uniref:Uncharacterized protein n=1 Tax=Paraburkholderia agricolaris TaxID=2152888 RepID=A0ABW9A078_9BURK